MSVIVTEQPAVEPVTVDDVKAHLGVTFAEDDDLIAGKITAARQYLERFCGVAMVTQTLKLVLDGFPSCGFVKLARPPLAEVVTVAYLDADLATQTIDAGDYVVRGVGATGYVIARSTWPRTAAIPGAVEITIRAGYGDAPEDVPEPLREAVRRLAADLYENREATVVGLSAAPLPFGVLELIGPFRERSF